ncbi:MAG: flagellar filament capping protein FliD [Polyangiaceae bacterium]
MTVQSNLAALGFGGIDTSTLVTSLVSLESQPLTALQTEQTNIQSASTSISNFSSTMSALSSAATALSDPTTFGGMTATSSDPSVVATASGQPAAGQWTVAVSSVAASQQTISNGAASTTAALGLSGTLALSCGGSSANIQVSATDSLTSIASAISSSGLPLQASIMYDGSQYHLLVSGENTGASNAITFNESGLSGSGYTLGLSKTSNTIQKAQDANLTVDGLPVTSSSNQVANAIPGVTFAVTQPTTAPATINIASDSSTLDSQVQSFVTAYNAVVSSGHTTAGYGSTAASNSLLQGDNAVNSSLDQLGQVIAAQVPGTTGAYTTLASVGISLNTDGTLSFDQSTFNTAVQADPSGVQSLFVSNAATGTTGAMGQLTAIINSATDPTSGSIQAEVNGFSTRSTAIGSNITNEQAVIAAYQTQLQNEFTQMNTMLAQYKQMSTALNDMSGTSSSSSSSSSSVL